MLSRHAVCPPIRHYSEASFKVTCNADKRVKENFRLIYKKEQASFDKSFRHFKRKYNNHTQTELYNLAADNSPNMWSKIKQLTSPPSKPPLEVIMSDGSLSRDVKDVLVKWHEDISKLYSGLRQDPELAFDDDFYHEILSKKEEFERISENEKAELGFGNYNTEELNMALSLEEVSKAIDKCKLGKAYLEIPNEVLKNANAKLLLHKFFNICFSSGLNPSEWYFSDIKPIPKPDKDPRDPMQNRCITILCCVAKVYSSLLNNRLQKFLESNKILVEEQNGFRSSRSCIDHIFVLITVLRNRKLLGKDTYLAFIDYKKAFDSVDRNLLFFKLALNGVSGKMYKAIAALYLNPKSRVILNEYETDYFACPIGVKQGDCLSPTLFAIFINDLATEIKESKLGIDLNVEGGLHMNYVLSILLYADDIVCFAEDENSLQSILFIIESWCKKWRLEVNLSKTNVLHVRKKAKPQSKFIFLFDMKPVPYCTSYKYLGVNINEHLDFKFTVEKHAESAGRALGSIITKMIKNNGFPYNVFSLLYKSCVTSIADYSGPLTGFHEYESANKVHLRAIRAFLGVPKNACNVAVMSEVDLPLPKCRTNIEMVRHYIRIHCMEEDRLTKIIYRWDRALNDRNIVDSWSNEVGKIFAKCNLTAAFNADCRLVGQSVVSHMIQELKKDQIEYLINECNNKPKLRTFRLFKDFQVMPPYIVKPLSFNHRRSIARIRLGSLPLRIETGRYSIPRIPEEERVCLACKPDGQSPEAAEKQSTSPVESESHFLLDCKAYDAERANCFSKMELPNDFTSLTQDNRLKYLLNHSFNVKFTAQFITMAMNIRSKLLDK